MTHIDFLDNSCRYLIIYIILYNTYYLIVEMNMVLITSVGRFLFFYV
jgi:hypothetical protein